MESELLKIVATGGSTLACFALVILFLKHIEKLHGFYSEKTEEALRLMAEKFNEEHVATRVAFQAQIQSLSTSFQTQIEGLTSRFFAMTESVSAIFNAKEK